MGSYYYHFTFVSMLSAILFNEFFKGSNGLLDHLIAVVV